MEEEDFEEVALEDFGPGPDLPPFHCNAPGLKRKHTTRLVLTNYSNLGSQQDDSKYVDLGARIRQWEVDIMMGSTVNLVYGTI